MLPSALTSRLAPLNQRHQPACAVCRCALVGNPAQYSGSSDVTPTAWRLAIRHELTGQLGKVTAQRLLRQGKQIAAHVPHYSL